MKHKKKKLSKIQLSRKFEKWIRSKEGMNAILQLNTDLLHDEPEEFETTIERVIEAVSKNKVTPGLKKEIKERRIYAFEWFKFKENEEENDEYEEEDEFDLAE